MERPKCRKEKDDKFYEQFDEKTKFIANAMPINAVHYKPPDILKVKIRRHVHLEDAKTMMKLVGKTR